MSAKISVGLGDLATDLAQANQRLAELQQKESFARNETTAQLNEVNRLQKAFDAAIVEIRNGAGTATDWGARRRSGQSMAAE